MAAPLPTLKSPPAASLDVISKEHYFQQDDDELTELKSNWVPTTLRTVPAFYPLEKSSRLVTDPPHAICSRLSECFRKLSIQAIYNNDTASLYTAENVEMHLSLWKTNTQCMPPAVVVELQRRKGDPIAFHRYSRSILDAAVGDELDATTMDDLIYSKKVQRLLAMELKNRELQEHENAVIAIEIAHGLLMKDRMDARRLGLESLCLLTDPRKTGYITAVLCSHVVLLGTTSGVHVPGAEQNEDVVMDESPFQEIREAVIGLVQFSRLREEDEEEAALDADSEHMMVLHNLALAVLANALDVIEHPERYDDSMDNEPEDTKPRGRLRTTSSNDVANEFLQQSSDFANKEMLSTLISELGKAEHKPHDATLSAKCLGSLLRASDDAKRRAKELGAKTVVSTALDVGVRTHLKLETECKKVVIALEQPPRDEDQA